MPMLFRAKRASLFVVLTALLALTCAPSAQALTVEHDEATFRVEETIDDICAFPIALSGTNSVRVTAFRNDEGNFVKVILHFSSTLTMSANGKTLSSGGRNNEFDVDFDPEGGAPSTVVEIGVSRLRLPGGGTIVQAGRIVVDVPTGSIVFEKGNLFTEGDASALCEALS